MNVWMRTVVGPALCGSAFLLPGCSPEQTGGDEQARAPTVTNRLDVPPDVVNNLGITFEVATRGRLGVWRQVPGELEVPERSRWVLRAPARARVLSVASRWQAVEKDAEVATLTSPELQRVQAEIERAERTLERATREVVAARARLAESETHVGEAESFEQVSRERLEELQALVKQGKRLTAKQIIEAR